MRAWSSGSCSWDAPPIPHYDRFLGWLSDRVSAAIMRVEEGMNLIEIDEKTALVRDRTDSP